MRLTRGNPTVAGAWLIAGCLAVVFLALSINLNFGLPMNLNLGWPPGFDYTLSAAFDDANGVAKGAGVVVAGNSIGQVTGVSASGRQAIVTMRIDRRYTPLHRGTVARIRYSTLLAEKYLELTPAAGTATIPSGSRIPSTSTITPVDFDQFLSTLDPQTRSDLQKVVQQAGGGVEGRQVAINALLDNLGNLAVESRAGLSTLHEHDADIGNITTNLDTTSRRLAQSRDNLGGFVQNTADVNGTIAAQDRSLSGLIYHLADTMTDFDATLNGEEGNFHGTVTEFDPFLVQLNGTLGYVDPYLHNNLGALATGLNTLIPEIGSAISEKDASGSYLRQYLVADCRYDSVQQSGAQPSCPSAPQANSAPPGPTGPAATSKPPAAVPSLCPTLPSTPNVTAPTPIPSISPCPSPLPPCFPGPGHPTPTPIPTPSPGTCIPGAGLINPPGTPVLPLPTPSLSGIITGLAEGGL
jgi:phospholipid/cholesterol/gamma-HCH transport system substrate-binding protein